MIIFVGPVFFLLLTTSFEQGTKAGLAVAVGIIISDVVCAVLCYYGLSQFLTASESQLWMAILGGLLLIGMGITYLLKKPNAGEFSARVKSTNISAVFIKGFLVNFVNPFVFMVWVGIIEVGKLKTGEDLDLMFYLMAVLFGIFTIDVAKVLLAKRIKIFIQPNVLLWIFRVTGAQCLFLGLGCWFLFYDISTIFEHT